MNQRSNNHNLPQLPDWVSLLFRSASDTAAINRSTYITRLYHQHSCQYRHISIAAREFPSLRPGDRFGLQELIITSGPSEPTEAASIPSSMWQGRLIMDSHSVDVDGPNPTVSKTSSPQIVGYVETQSCARPTQTRSAWPLSVLETSCS